MVVVCEDCGKTLINQFSLSRHMRSYHSNEMEDNTESLQSENESSVEEEEEEDNESELSSDEDEEEHIKTGWQNQFWRRIMTVAIHNLGYVPSSVHELTGNDTFPVFLSNLRDLYNNHKFYNRALEESKLHDKITDETQHYEDKLNFSIKEAENMVWLKLKHMFKKLVIHNKDILEDVQQEDIQSSTSDDNESNVVAPSRQMYTIQSESRPLKY